MSTLSQNITQAINDFGAIKTAIENKGITVSSGTSTSQYGNIIAGIPTGITPSGTKSITSNGTHDVTNYASANVDVPSSYHDELVNLIERNYQSWEFDIPYGITRIGEGAFRKTSLTRVTIPDTVTRIELDAFVRTRIPEIVLPNSITYLGQYVFQACYQLTTAFIPSSLSSSVNDAFFDCPNLEYVTLGNNFNVSIRLDYSTKYSADTIVGWLNALADRTGQEARTLTMGSTNLAKLTADQIAIATNKNWNLA